MTEHVDPRGRDPQFPNRPTHQDFVDLSETLQEMDRLAEVERVAIPEILGLDMESFLYMVTNRLGTVQQRHQEFLQRAPVGVALRDQQEMFLTAIYLDAFTAGKRFAERRAGEDR